LAGHDNHENDRHKKNDLGNSEADSKVSTSGALQALFERHADAPSRAQALDTHHLSSGSLEGENPSSNVWRLI